MMPACGRAATSRCCRCAAALFPVPPWWPPAVRQELPVSLSKVQGSSKCCGYMCLSKPRAQDPQAARLALRRSNMVKPRLWAMARALWNHPPFSSASVIGHLNCQFPPKRCRASDRRLQGITKHEMTIQVTPRPQISRSARHSASLPRVVDSHAWRDIERMPPALPDLPPHMATTANEQPLSERSSLCPGPKSKVYFSAVVSNWLDRPLAPGTPTDVSTARRNGSVPA